MTHLHERGKLQRVFTTACARGCRRLVLSRVEGRSRDSGRGGNASRMRGTRFVGPLKLRFGLAFETTAFGRRVSDLGARRLLLRAFDGANCVCDVQTLLRSLCLCDIGRGLHDLPNVVLNPDVNRANGRDVPDLPPILTEREDGPWYVTRSAAVKHDVLAERVAQRFQMA